MIRSISTTKAPRPSVTPLFGAIVGDIAGSAYEFMNCKSEKCTIFHDDCQYTDDSVLTLATAQHLLKYPDSSYTDIYQKYGWKYPDAGYGGSFIQWLQSYEPKPYHSWGNGSAMRASPIGWVAKDLDWALEEASKSASVTHNHPEGIKGAQAVVAAVFLAREGKQKREIRSYISETFGYDLDRTIDEIRPDYAFDVSCQGSVPEAIIAFLESTSFENAVRKAISLGGDSDTIACITGAIAHAFYGEIPNEWVEHCRNNILDSEQLRVNDAFWQRYEEGSLSNALIHKGGHTR